MTSGARPPAPPPSDDKHCVDRIRVLYDGECAMCANLALRIETGTARDRFATEDLRRASLPAGITRAAVERELHVVTADGAISRGPDAVLRLLEEYPHWRWLSKLGRRRVVRPFTLLGYRFVAANRAHIFGPAARIFWTKQITLLALLAGVCLSPTLWTADRAYPLAPVIDLAATAGPLAWTPLLALLCGALAALLMPRPRVALLVLLTAAAWLALGDQTRWQPWFYQYCALIALSAAWRWSPNMPRAGSERAAEIIAALRVIPVGLYFWSGFQKLNVSYLDGATGWLLEPLRGLLPATLVDAFGALGPLVPGTEMAIGIGLLWPRTRKAAVIAAVLMHLLVLSMLGPWGHDWNSVVWPWNTAMIALVVALFWSDRRTSARAIVGTPMSVTRGVTITAFCILPMLGTFGALDPYLSASLYARNLPDAAILVDRAARDSLPPSTRAYVDRNGVLWPMTWALDEMNVPAYPAPRVYKALGREICRRTSHPEGVTLQLGSRPHPFTGEISVRRYTCAQL